MTVKHLELPKRKWQDLKSTHCIDIMKMVTLLLTQGICLIQQCTSAFKLIFIMAKIYAVQVNRACRTMVCTNSTLSRVCTSATGTTRNNNTSLATLSLKTIRKNQIKRKRNPTCRSKCIVRALIIFYKWIENPNSVLAQKSDYPTACKKSALILF